MVLGFGSIWVNAGVFLAAAATVAVVGPRLSRSADRIGRITGLGQTVAGAILLGASTSLPGLIVTAQTALAGRPNMAVANALGGIAAQTLFVAFADVALRDDTIEHGNALAESLLQSTVLISLLAVALLAMINPDIAVYGSVHPASPVILVGIIAGFVAINETRKHPSWRARHDGGGGQTDPGSGGESGRSGGGSSHGGDGTVTDRGGGDGSPDDAGPADSGSGSRSVDPSTDVVLASVETEERVLSLPLRRRRRSIEVVREGSRDAPAGPTGREGRSASGSREGSGSGGNATESSSARTGSVGTSRSSDGSETDSSGPSGSRNDESGSAGGVYRRYAVYVVAIAVAGYVISTSAGTIVRQTGFSPLVMGLTFTAIATSLPELVTAVVSVRRGAVGLAVGDIVGGNAFDTIMVAVADFIFVPASIYAAVSDDVMFVAGLALLMTGILVSGFIRRDRRGLANVGVETYLVVLVYVLGVATVLLGTVVSPGAVLP